MRSGRLRVTNVTAADNGVYACEARNRAGVTESNGNFLMTTRGKWNSYYTTIGDLCGSGSVHLYGFPGITTH